MHSDSMSSALVCKPRVPTTTEGRASHFLKGSHWPRTSKEGHVPAEPALSLSVFGHALETGGWALQTSIFMRNKEQPGKPKERRNQRCSMYS